MGHEITLNADNHTAISLISVVSVFLFLAFFAVLLRIPARRHTNSKFNLSDYAICLALFFLCGLAISEYVSCIIGGIGKPMKEMGKSRKYINVTIESTKFGWLAWAAANTCVRISMLSMLNTIFWSSDFTRRGTYVLGVANLCYFTGVLIEFAVICRPFNFYWRTGIPGKCGDIQMGILVCAIFNLILDFLLIMLPMPALWKLQMPLKKKLGVMCVFGIGALICAITVLRIFTVREFAKPSSKKTWSTSIYHDAVLTSIEPSLGIINACVPLFPAVYRAFAGTKFGQKTVSFLSSVTGRSGSQTSSQPQTATYHSGNFTPNFWRGGRKNDSENQNSSEKARTSLGSKGSSQDSLRKKSGTTSVHSMHDMDTDLAGMDLRGMILESPPDSVMRGQR